MRILMWHFRSAPADRTRLTGLQDPGDSAGTDGVSLEMMKRRAMLEAEGHEVAVSSAYSWSEFPIAALEFDSDAVTTMMRNLFGSHIGDFDNEDALTQAFEAPTAALAPGPAGRPGGVSPRRGFRPQPPVSADSRRRNSRFDSAAPGHADPVRCDSSRHSQ